MYLKINALGDYKKKYDPFARLLALKRGVGVCSVVGVVSGFYGTSSSTMSCTVVSKRPDRSKLIEYSSQYCRYKVQRRCRYKVQRRSSVPSDV